MPQASPITETLATLREARSRSASCLVGYSGGKDSRVVMDLACRSFDHVEGVFKYLVPGLEITESLIADAKKRWGVAIHQYPSQNSINALRNGMFCDPSDAMEALPEMSSWHVWAAALRDTKIPLLLLGMKRSDSQSRRRIMAWQSANKQVVHPIAGWEKIDVLGYLRMQGIPIPDGSGGRTSGVELVPSELEWLADKHPRDFAKVQRYFKYIDAVVWRKRFYGEEIKGGPGSRRKGPGRTRARNLHDAEAAASAA